MNPYLPTSIELLKIISNQMTALVPIFKADTPEFNNFKTKITEKQAIELNSFQTTKSEILYVQILFLITLSMDQSILNSHIKSINQKKESIHLIWKNSISNKFQPGVYDKECETFFKKYYQQICKALFKNNHITSTTLLQTKAQLQYNLGLLNHARSQITQLLENQNQLDSFLKTNKDYSLLFILISALPNDQLNALLLHIQQFFPDDLEIKSSQGNKIQITSLFQSTSSDMKFLLEKVKIYFDLYVSMEKPIIQHITQDKTKGFLIELLKNTQVKESTLTNLKKILEDQIIQRIFLHLIFINHLGVLL